MADAPKQKTGVRAFIPEDIFHRALFPRGHYNKAGTRVIPAAFKHSRDGSGPSVDWAEFATPQETAGRWIPRWQHFGVVKVASISYQACTDCGRDVRHAPEKDNFAHCLIEGQDDVTRVKLARAATIVYSSNQAV